MKKRESGQALVLVLLSLSVILTLVLYVVSRSVTDVAVTSVQEESVRAFSAAEAGIENALITGSAGSDVTVGNSTYSTTVAATAVSTEFAYPLALSNGDSATIWLASNNGSGILTKSFAGSAIKVCWGNSEAIYSSTTPAVEVSLYYETVENDLSTIKIARWAFDPFVSRTPSNNFVSTGSFSAFSCPTGESYTFSKTMTLPAAGEYIFVRVKMLYNDTPQDVGVVTTGGNLPSQGKIITSTGIAGESNRKISVFTGWPEFPFVSNALFSPYGIVK